MAMQPRSLSVSARWRSARFTRAGDRHQSIADGDDAIGAEYVVCVGGNRAPQKLDRSAIVSPSHHH
jgi:hypothetical protein